MVALAPLEGRGSQASLTPVRLDDRNGAPTVPPGMACELLAPGDVREMGNSPGQARFGRLAQYALDLDGTGLIYGFALDDSGTTRHDKQLLPGRTDRVEKHDLDQ